MGRLEAGEWCVEMRKHRIWFVKKENEFEGNRKEFEGRKVSDYFECLRIVTCCSSCWSILKFISNVFRGLTEFTSFHRCLLDVISKSSENSWRKRTREREIKNENVCVADIRRIIIFLLVGEKMTSEISPLIVSEIKQMPGSASLFLVCKSVCNLQI